MMKTVKTAVAFVLVGAALSSVGVGQVKPGVPLNTVHWKSLIPEIRMTLKRTPMFQQSVDIEETADITGDDVPEALVFLGTGGASTC